MKFSAKDSAKPVTKSDLFVVFALKGKKLELPKGLSVAKHAFENFKGNANEKAVTDTGSGHGLRVMAVGLGELKKVTPESLRRAAAIGSKRAEALGLASVGIICPAAVSKALGEERTGCAIAEGAVMGTYKFDAARSKQKAAMLKSTTAYGPGKKFAAGAKRGAALAVSNMFTRDLQNEPGNRMRPRDMVAAAKKIAKSSTAVTCKALTEADMKKLGMGSLLSVSAGSVEPAFLIHLTYKPKGKSKGKIAFVGKGLTFDAGGISIKPAHKMWDMKYDMSGGAAVLGAMHALAAIGCDHEVHGIVATSENLIDGNATKPGDVVTAMNGTTIEVLNTDAEGRLILADAICYTLKKVKPDTMLDLATLTGAVVVGLGHELSGIFPTSDSLRDDLIAAGKETGEEVWPLPLLDAHKRHLKSKVADIANINAGQGAGSSAGAAFLAKFVDDTEWSHIDIAGAAWGSDNRDWVGGSMGSGVGARLLVQYLATRS
ncbi:MAG: leucyl aminopeptidase [Planctomycetota bacterium]|jgi:leucyl aminopeptidase